MTQEKQVAARMIRQLRAASAQLPLGSSLQVDLDNTIDGLTTYIPDGKDTPHVQIQSGYCEVCDHYGEDCEGTL